MHVITMGVPQGGTCSPPHWKIKSNHR